MCSLNFSPKLMHFLSRNLMCPQPAFYEPDFHELSVWYVVWRCQVAKIGCLGRGVVDSAIRFDTIFEAICLGSFRSGSFWAFCGCRLLQAQARKSIKRSSLQTMTRSGWRYEIFTSLMWVNSHLNDFCSMSSIFGLHFQLLLKTWFLGGNRQV